MKFNVTKWTPQEIAAQVEALAPPDRLRLAADLMEARLGHIAYPIIAKVAAELGAAIALADGAGS